MTKIKIFQVDSFADRPFKGNPAGVCILDNELSENLMQSVAMEMNLSETAFAVPATQGPVARQDQFNLRWFTPTVEVDLCGHATLATARTLFDEYGVEAASIHFFTKSGELIVSRKDDRLAMDFPVDLTDNEDIPSEILKAMGIEKSIYTASSRNLNMKLIEVSGMEIVRKLRPNFGNLKAAGESFPNGGFLVTSRWGEGGFDIISRFFAPIYGIDEDPVTGAAHTVLGPYWSKKLGKNEIKSYQASARGGEVEVVVKGDRVDIIGDAVIVMRAEMTIP